MKCTILAALPGEVAVHRGGACDDPNCAHRRSVVEHRSHFRTPMAEHLRIKARELRMSLGLGAPSKADYVRREAEAPPTRPHFCHVPGCKEEVPSVYLMCGAHWRMVPKALRDRVWGAYQPGQEKGEREPSPEYLEAAKLAIAAVQEALSPKVAEEPQLSLFGGRGS